MQRSERQAEVEAQLQCVLALPGPEVQVWWQPEHEAAVRQADAAVQQPT